MNLSENIGIGLLLVQFAANIVSGQANCNQWSSWINDNHPDSFNKNDKEVITQSFRDNFCPSNANTDKYQCKDNNGEPFDRNITTADYVTTCGIDEVSCVLTNAAFDKCPDLSIRFKCDCTSTRTPLATTKTTVRTHTSPDTKTSIQQTTTLSTLSTNMAKQQLPSSHGHSVTGSSKSPVTTDSVSNIQSSKTERETISNDSGYLDIGGTHIQWWILVLAASILMFLFNIILTLCIFKYIKRKYQQKRQRQNGVQVHPLGAI